MFAGLWALRGVQTGCVRLSARKRYCSDDNGAHGANIIGSERRKARR